MYTSENKAKDVLNKSTYDTGVKSYKAPRTHQLKDNRLNSTSTIQRMFPRHKVSYKSDDASEAREWREEDRGIGGRNIASLYYTEKATNKNMVTSEHSKGAHSEKLIQSELINKYGPNYKQKLIFDTLFTERDTCGPDYHNCRKKVPEWFPNVKVTYSALYPAENDMSDSSAESSGEETKRSHRRKKAKKGRRQGTAKIKRADKHAGEVAKGNKQWSDFADSEDED
ncbi:hypothetical protein HJ160_03790 [Vibrio parahaemolyticus]|nr:hypothetical protein [Vibrio parahaemolyticus]